MSPLSSRTPYSWWSILLHLNNQKKSKKSRKSRKRSYLPWSRYLPNHTRQSRSKSLYHYDNSFHLVSCMSKLVWWPPVGKVKVQLHATQPCIIRRPWSRHQTQLTKKARRIRSIATQFVRLSPQKKNWNPSMLAATRNTSFIGTFKNSIR